MKHLVFFFLLSAFTATAQNQVKIERIVLHDRIIHGKINDAFPITIYLNFHDYAADNFNYYSVEGWYYYDNIRKKIPLVGVYSGSLVLYEFEKQTSRDSVLNLLGTGENFTDQLDELFKKRNYKERFVLDYQDFNYQGTWDNHKKNMPVSLNASDLSVDELNDYLYVTFQGKPTYHYDLSWIGSVDHDYEIAASKVHEGKYRILLRYETPSSGNPNGLCGAGMEIGYVFLLIDESGEIIEFQEETVESCLGDVSSEKGPDSNDVVLEYLVYDNSDNERIVRINLANVSIDLSK